MNDQEIQKLIEAINRAVGDESVSVKSRSLIIREESLGVLKDLVEEVKKLNLGESERTVVLDRVSSAIIERVKEISVREFPTEVSIKNLPTAFDISNFPSEIGIKKPSWIEGWLQKQNENEGILIQILQVITGISRIVPNLKVYEGKTKDALRTVLVDKDGNEYSITDDLLKVMNLVTNQIRGSGGGSSSSGGVDPVGIKNVAGVAINPSTEETLQAIEALLATIDADTGALVLKDFATQTTLALLNAKFVNGNDIGDVTINNATIEQTVGDAVNTLALMMGGSDGTNVRRIKTDSNGELQVDVLTIPSVTVSSLPALATGSNVIGSVNQGTSPWVIGHGKTIKSVGGSCATNGNNTLISAVADKKLKVFNFILSTTSTSAVTCIFQSGAGGTELSRVILQAPTGSSTGAVDSVSIPSHLFETAVNTLLNLNLNAAQTIHYSISYFEEA